jgi:hypothetical protein
MAKLIAGLGRRAQFLLLGAAVCGAAAVYILASGGSTTSPSLGEALFVQPVPVTDRLYSGATDPKTGAPVSPYARATEILGAGGVPTARYLDYKDGSLEVIELSADGKRPKTSRLYWASAAGDESFHLKKVSIYADNGTDIVDQNVFREDGTRSEHSTMRITGRVMPSGTVLEKKWKDVTAYHSDGVTIIGQQAWFKDEFTDLVIVKEERWLPNPQHSRVYLNVYNVTSDTVKNRVITEFDENNRVLKHTEINISNHSVAKAYYPKTFKLRFEGSSDFTTNTVTFYREDGTKERLEVIGPSQIEITYFDTTGTKTIGKQAWWHEEVGLTAGDAKGITGLYMLYEFDASGEETRDIYWYQGKMRRDARNNFTVDGVTYKQVEWRFDDNENLNKVEFYLNARSEKPVKVEQHTPEEKIGANFVEPALLVLPPREPGLVIPIKQTGYP